MPSYNIVLKCTALLVLIYHNLGRGLLHCLSEAVIQRFQRGFVMDLGLPFKQWSSCGHSGSSGIDL